MSRNCNTAADDYVVWELSVAAIREVDIHRHFRCTVECRRIFDLLGRAKAHERAGAEVRIGLSNTLHTFAGPFPADLGANATTALAGGPAAPG
jgi:hypothetical protein